MIDPTEREKETNAQPLALHIPGEEPFVCTIGELLDALLNHHGGEEGNDER